MKQKLQIYRRKLHFFCSLNIYSNKQRPLLNVEPTTLVKIAKHVQLKKLCQINEFFKKSNGKFFK